MYVSTILYSFMKNYRILKQTNYSESHNQLVTLVRDDITRILLIPWGILLQPEQVHHCTPVDYPLEKTKRFLDLFVCRSVVHFHLYFASFVPRQ
jgi:hypothetical protein